MTLSLWAWTVNKDICIMLFAIPIMSIHMKIYLFIFYLDFYLKLFNISCMNWLIAGERNTSYFHLSTIVRRSANRISCVKLENEEWIYDVDQTKHYFQEGFLKLYTIESLLSTRDMTLEMACCRLSAHEAVELACIPSNAEILVALEVHEAI